MMWFSTTAGSSGSETTQGASESMITFQTGLFIFRFSKFNTRQALDPRMTGSKNVRHESVMRWVRIHPGRLFYHDHSRK